MSNDKSECVKHIYGKNNTIIGVIYFDLDFYDNELGPFDGTRYKIVIYDEGKLKVKSVILPLDRIEKVYHVYGKEYVMHTTDSAINRVCFFDINMDDESTIGNLLSMKPIGDRKNVLIKNNNLERFK